MGNNMREKTSKKGTGASNLLLLFEGPVLGFSFAFSKLKNSSVVGWLLNII